MKACRYCYLVLALGFFFALSAQAADENLGIWRNSTTGIWRDTSAGEWRPTAETETVLNVIFRVITSGQKLFERIGVVQ
jgi:hypothetical protein